MYVKPSNKPLSEKTGYLYDTYLELIKMMRRLNKIRIRMEKSKPWFDPEK